MDDKSGIKTVVSLACKLTDLCEGFDESNKSCVMNSKFRVMMVIDKYGSVCPSVLKDEVAIAKSNLTILCKKMIENGEVEKVKDLLDGRCVKYKLTEKGRNYLYERLSVMENNFISAVSYKNNLQNIKQVAESLVKMVNN